MGDLENFSFEGKGPDRIISMFPDGGAGEDKKKPAKPASDEKPKPEPYRSPYPGLGPDGGA
ncbi:hypothetical protein HY090_03205 [Candidatus Kaiserbacteria bacterium]|nr:hypothetical protein [Candidatus Kaiserbacteria bacterium]